jgi:hypothetical protein
VKGLTRPPPTSSTRRSQFLQKGELPLNARSILLAVSSSCSDALDGSVFASLPFDTETIEWLDQRARCFLKAREAYPDLYETYEFDCRLQ